MISRTSHIVLSLALALSLPCAVGCSSGTSTAEKTDEAVEQVKEDEVKLTDEDVSSKDESANDSASTQKTQETKRIGAEGVGFMEVPANWVEFKDVDGNTSIQWCDGTPYTIVSLNTFDIDSVPEELRDESNAMTAANSVWTNILNDGVSEDAIKGARVTLAGREALQVYAQYPDGSYLVCWLVEDDNGGVRYVAAEGPENTIFNTVGMVEDTYEL